MSYLVDRLFAYARIDRSKAGKPKANVSKTFDALVNTIGVKLNAEEKKLPSGLAQIVANVTAERASSYRFIPFPMHELQDSFVLVAPRKVNTYVASQRTLNAQAASAAASANGGAPKEKVKRESSGGGKGNPAWRVGFGKPRASRAHLQEDLGHFVAEDEDRDEDGDFNPRKRERLFEDENSAADLGAPEQILSSAESIVLPKNFYQVIYGVFEQFWSMEFDDPAVSQAFFAKIDINNCRAYGLEVFAESSMSLSVIRDRLDATNATGATSTGYSLAYRSPEDFYSDFRQMFENIFAFFPPQSAPQLKAIELNTLFHVKWEAAKASFKYK